MLAKQKKADEAHRTNPLKIMNTISEQTADRYTPSALRTANLTTSTAQKPDTRHTRQEPDWADKPQAHMSRGQDGMQPAPQTAAKFQTPDDTTQDQATDTFRPVVLNFKPRFFSGKPKVIQDGHLAKLRLVWNQLRKLEALHELPEFVPDTAANPPATEMGLAAPLLGIVALAASSAIQQALKSYSTDYPAAARKVLDQQVLMIDALAHNQVGPKILAPLRQLHREGTEALQARQKARDGGWGMLMDHNLHNKKHGVNGVGDLSKAFNQQLTEVIESHMAKRGNLPTLETSYQQDQLLQLERARQVAKKGRTVSVLAAVSPTAILGSMLTDVANRGLELAAQKATEAAKEGLETIAGQLATTATAIAMVAQGTRIIRNGLELQALYKQHRELQNNEAALRYIVNKLAPEVKRIHEQDTDYRLVVSQKLVIANLTDIFAQAALIASGATAVGAPATLAAGMALEMTAAATRYYAKRQHAAHTGHDARPELKGAQDIPNLGHSLRQADSLTPAIDLAGREYVDLYRDVVQTRLWDDLLSAISDGEPTQDGQQLATNRHERLAHLNDRKHGVHRMLPNAAQALEQLRQAHYPVAYFNRPTADIHRQLHLEILQHPHRTYAEKLYDFRQEVMRHTMDELADHHFDETAHLFQDANGELIRSLDEDRYRDIISASPLASEIHRRHYNKTMVAFLGPSSKYGQKVHFQLLSDLARTQDSHNQTTADHLGHGHVIRF